MCLFPFTPPDPVTAFGLVSISPKECESSVWLENSNISYPLFCDDGVQTGANEENMPSKHLGPYDQCFNRIYQT